MHSAHRPQTDSRSHLDELNFVTHDTEGEVGLERERRFAHTLATLILLPNRYRLAIRLKDRLTMREVNAHGVLVGNRLAVLEERIEEHLRGPHCALTDAPELGTNCVPHLTELI